MRDLNFKNTYSRVLLKFDIMVNKYFILLDGHAYWYGLCILSNKRVYLFFKNMKNQP